MRLLHEYTVESPEQLRKLGEHLKTGRVDNTAVIWGVDRRRAKGRCALDGRIRVRFEAGLQERTCTVVRCGIGSTVTELARLKYRDALIWCRENLKEVFY